MQGKDPSTHCTGGWVGPRSGLNTEARGKILSPLPGIKPRSPGCQARSQTLYWLSYLAHLILVYITNLVQGMRNKALTTCCKLLAALKLRVHKASWQAQLHLWGCMRRCLMKFVSRKWHNASQETFGWEVQQVDLWSELRFAWNIFAYIPVSQLALRTHGFSEQN
jgi:hypothetical protein